MSAAETNGISFDFLAARISCPPWPALMLRRGSVHLTPVIEIGKTYPDGDAPYRYRSPDTFKHFRIVLRAPWWRAFFLRRMLRKRVAFEMWTKSDQDYVRWLFPYTSLKAKGWTRFEGRTYEGPGVTRDDIPDGMPIASGGYWKVKSVP